MHHPTPFSHESLLQAYQNHQETLGYAAKTLIRDKREAIVFWQWAATQSHSHPLTITPNMVATYSEYLGHCRLLQPQTVQVILRSLMRVYRWFVSEELTRDNPFEGLKLAGHSRSSTHRPLTTAQISRLMAVPDLTTPLGIRDRAILEAFYSTGLRKTELARLTCLDLDAAGGWVRVQISKTKTSRVVPIGESALYWVMRYLAQVRPHLLRGSDPGNLFVSYRGKSFVEQGTLSNVVKKAMIKAGILTYGSAHLLRHSAATHMLQRGADIRVIQTMLGHQCIDSTQRYTHTTCGDLKTIHRRCHPWP